jgi:hypothetical protein
MVGESMTPAVASYDAWVDAYERAFLDPRSVSVMTCPNCGYERLNLIFVVRSQEADRGSASFWCDHCLSGVVMAPAPVPEHGRREFTDSADIPNFKVVPPPGRHR